MGNVNCLRCRFRHEDNGNCTAVGGFCTAVTAAHCPLLREYLDTRLEPEAVETVKLALAAKHLVDLETLNNTPISRLVELAEADKDGCVIILPCKVYETDGVRVYEHTVREVIYETAGGPAFDKNAIGKSIFLTREEAERASRETQGKEDADGATDKPE